MSQTNWIITTNVTDIINAKPGLSRLRIFYSPLWIYNFLLFDFWGIEHPFEQSNEKWKFRLTRNGTLCSVRRCALAWLKREGVLSMVIGHIMMLWLIKWSSWGRSRKLKSLWIIKGETAANLMSVISYSLNWKQIKVCYHLYSFVLTKLLGDVLHVRWDWRPSRYWEL